MWPPCGQPLLPWPQSQKLQGCISQCKKCVVHLTQIPKKDESSHSPPSAVQHFKFLGQSQRCMYNTYTYMSHICAFSISNSTLSNLSKSWMRSHSTVRLAASAACRRWWHLLRRVARRARPGWRSWRQRAEPELWCHGKRWCFVWMSKHEHVWDEEDSFNQDGFKVPTLYLYIQYVSLKEYFSNIS